MEGDKRVSFREDQDTEPLLPDVQIISPDDEDDDDQGELKVEEEQSKCNRCGFPRRRCISEGPSFGSSWSTGAGASAPEPIPQKEELDGPSIAASLPAQLGQLSPSYYSSMGESAHRVVFCTHGNVYGVGTANCCPDTKVENGNVVSTTTERERKDSYAEHCHPNRNEGIDKKARKRLILASILCVVFMVAEIVGGYLANSLAIATDAAHLLTDFASFMISLFSLWVATRPATKRMSFGWYRAEVIGALTSVLLIWVVTGVLVYMAVQRVIDRDFEIEADIMLIISGVGVAVNIVMGFTLHQHGHGHGGGHGHSHGSGGGHGHSHGDGGESGNGRAAQNTNINVRAAFIHVLGDLLQSVGVFVAALIIFFKPEWKIVDPICTFMFSVLVLATTFAIMKDTLTVLMEGMPKGIDFNDVLNTLLQIEGVVRVHNLRIWALSMDKTALAAHLAIEPGVGAQSVLKQASHLIRSKYDFFEMTLQIEDFRAEMEDCTQCQCPEK